MKKLFFTSILSTGKNIPTFPFTTSSLNTYLWALLIIVASGNSGCGDDDEKPTVFVNAAPTEVSFTEINKCFGGGAAHTEFFFAIPYETSANQQIDKVIYSVKASGDPGTPAENEKDDFEDTGTQIKFSLCFQFGGAPSIDFKYTLVSVNGIKSAPRTTIINRPAGAN